VDEAAADASAGVLAWIAAASGAVSSSVGDRRELFYVGVDQLARRVPHVAAHRVLAVARLPLSSRSQARGSQDRLNRRRGQADFGSDVVRSPAPPPTGHHLGVLGRRRGVRGGTRAARAVLEPVRTLGREPIAPFANSLGLRTVLASAWNRAAAAVATVQCPWSSKAAVLRRPTEVSAAFGCRVLTQAASPPGERELSDAHSLSRKAHLTPHRQGQRPRPSQLERRTRQPETLPPRNQRRHRPQYRAPSTPRSPQHPLTRKRDRQKCFRVVRVSESGPAQ